MFKSLVHILLFLPFLMAAQQKQSTRMIKILKASTFSYDRERTEAQVLKGDVVCEHEGTLLYCDTAYFFENQNKIIATGHIVILKGDSIRVTGEKLTYDGRTRMATLTNKVKVVEKDMTLTTDLLTFDVANSVASYFNGGKLVHKENTLVSKNGHYFSSRKEAAFHYDVLLTNPDYRMDSDTLKYRISNKTAYFLGPSVITSKTDYIYCENGWYDTENQLSQFSRNALLVTSQQKLRGDSLVYNRTTGVGRAYRNVQLIDTGQKSTLFGQYIEYREKKSEAIATGKPIYQRIIDNDTLFLAADTLYHLDIDSVNNFLSAWYHVRIYKKDIQAICDSASLSSKDSLLQLFREPILWNQRMQATSKIIRVDIGNNRVKGFTLDGKAFLSQQVDSLYKENFNQMTGKVIMGLIENDSIRRIQVNGTPEILYFARNGEKYIGLNKTNSTFITLWFAGSEVSRVTMKNKTSGQIDPFRDIQPASTRLKGFSWHNDKRPRSKYDLHPITNNK